MGKPRCHKSSLAKRWLRPVKTLFGVGPAWGHRKPTIWVDTYYRTLNVNSVEGSMLMVGRQRCSTTPSRTRSRSPRPAPRRPRSSPPCSRTTCPRTRPPRLVDSRSPPSTACPRTAARPASSSTPAAGTARSSRRSLPRASISRARSQSSSTEGRSGDSRSRTPPSLVLSVRACASQRSIVGGLILRFRRRLHRLHRSGRGWRNDGRERPRSLPERARSSAFLVSVAFLVDRFATHR